MICGFWKLQKCKAEAEERFHLVSEERRQAESFQASLGELLELPLHRSVLVLQAARAQAMWQIGQISSVRLGIR